MSTFTYSEIEKNVPLSTIDFIFSPVINVEKEKRFLKILNASGLPKEKTYKDIDKRNREEIEKLRNSKSQTKDSDTKLVCTDGSIELKSHQTRVVKHMIYNRGIITSFDTGTGKTLTAVAVARCLLENNIIKHVHVVTPASLVENFRQTIYKFDKKVDISKYKFFTFNKYTTDYRDNKLECEDGLVIVDEAHEMRTDITEAKNINKLVISVLGCSLKAKRVLLLTATPLYNDVSDISNLLAIVKGIIPSENHKNLIEKDIRTLERNKWELDKDKEYYTKNMFAFFKIKTEGIIPKIIRTGIKGTMSDSYFAEYQKVEKRLDKDHPNPYVFLTGLRQSANSFPDNVKINFIVARISEKIKTRYKFLIYSEFKAKGINLIITALRNADIFDKENMFSITGDISKQRRNEIVETFNKNEKGILFITKAGYAGLDLKGVREVILLEPSWSFSTEKQVIGRAARIGSHDHLPENERIVRVLGFLIRKPAGFEDKPSADELVYSHAIKKAKDLERYEKGLRFLALK